MIKVRKNFLETQKIKIIYLRIFKKRKVKDTKELRKYTKDVIKYERTNKHKRFKGIQKNLN